VRQRWIAAAALAVVTGTGGPVYAQRTTENAVNTAEDAFGVSVGNETIGLYTASSARGFSPTQAGNIRLEGLYFDQQLFTGGRIYAGTTVRVGLSGQSYPFPAPTGIVDTKMRRPGDHITGSASVTFGPYDSFQFETEVATSLVPGKLGALGSLSVVAPGRFDWQTKYDHFIYGGSVNWTPSEAVDVVVFNQGHTGGQAVQPLIFTTGGAVPKEYDRSVFFGQRWAWRQRAANHGGFIMSAKLFDDWTLRAGLFRSYTQFNRDYVVFFRGVDSDGSGALDVLQAPGAHSVSYSGEARLARAISEGPRHHVLNLNVRGRTADHYFGGGSSVFLGPARVGVDLQRPEPLFPPQAATNLNQIRQVTPGISYVGRWFEIGEFSVGGQKSYFRSEVAPAGGGSTRTKSQPWLYNSTLAVYVSEYAALYGSYTRGAEESGVAPENANNRGEALPVSLTEQVDAGIRYKLSSRASLVAGVFEVKKPFFDRNAVNLFAEVGHLSHRGVELSLSGQIAPGLTVVAGAMLLRARIEADAAVASFIGRVPTGRRNRTVRLNFQYAPLAWRGFAVDGQLNQDGPGYANRANTVRLEANTTLDLGARYLFKMFDTAMSLRVRALNITNAYGWTVSPSGSYAPIPMRRFTAQLAADF